MSIKKIQKTIDKLDEANKNLEQQFQKQKDHCTKLLYQIKKSNGRNSQHNIAKEKM